MNVAGNLRLLKEDPTLRILRLYATFHDLRADFLHLRPGDESGFTVEFFDGGATVACVEFQVQLIDFCVRTRFGGSLFFRVPDRHLSQLLGRQFDVIDVTESLTTDALRMWLSRQRARGARIV